MTTEILMPALSPTMTAGNLIAWHKKEGDAVKSGDLLAEIETDKATMEVEAVDEGVLGKILVAAGTAGVAVNQVIAVLLEEGESPEVLATYSPTSANPATPPVSAAPVAAAAPSTAPNQAVVQTVELPAPAGQRVLSSPLARRLADQNHVHLPSISGSGPKGRIVKQDVLAAVAGGIAAPIGGGVASDVAYIDLPISTMRGVIAQRLTASKTTVPHFYVTVDCTMDALLSTRQQLNASLPEDQRVSVNDFIILACARTLKAVPAANASWMDTFVRQYTHADVAVAVAIEGGLITPIIPKADTLSLLQISTQAKALVAKARGGKLQPHEFQGGTFSLSNMGMYGIKQFNAILNPPQGCILAVGAAEKRAIVQDDQIVIATQATMTLSVDHRVIDGSVAAQWMTTFKNFIEHPLLLLV